MADPAQQDRLDDSRPVDDDASHVPRSPPASFPGPSHTQYPSPIIQHSQSPQSSPQIQHAQSPQSSPRVQYSPNVATHDRHRFKRRPSEARSVNVDFFDPEGVKELRREISRTSEAQSSHHPGSESGSEHTLQEGRFDLEKTLRNIMEKMDEADIQRRQLGVMFKDLRVIGLGATASHQATFGSFLNPLNIMRNINQLRHPALRDILSGFEGVVRPREMLLVLGRPGAGCSTLLRVLANQRSEYHSIEGTVHYDSFSPSDIESLYRGDVQYCPEDDVHFPTLTVEQTLMFAAKTRTPHTRIEGESRDAHMQRIVDILSTVFGLRHVKNTLVGDASIRGVSGGEKKRVSISEALATLSRLTCWDNSTRGLDASTALEFVQALRIATDITNQSTLVSIYQAGESLYRHFDKVCVIYEGRMVYFGPANRARDYFIEMGYEPANRQTTADFLVAVTDPNGRIVREGYENKVPRTASEFADYYFASEVAAENRADMESYREEHVDKDHKRQSYRQSVAQAHAQHTRRKSPYITSIPMQVRALMIRRVQILKGGFIAPLIQMMTFVAQAIIVGTVFFRLSDSTLTFFSRGGVLFFAILFAAISTMAEIPALFAQRPIVLRQSRAAMYHPFVDSLALTLVDVPITAGIIIIFSIVLYFLVGLQEHAGNFFYFLLIVFTMTLTMKAFFRTLAAAFGSPAPAQTFAGLSVLLLVLYTGYTIPQPSMIGALRWITYINPLRYGFESLMVNEFHPLTGECAVVVPTGPGYEGITAANQVCTTVGSVPGQTTVSGERYLQLSFGYTFSHIWRNYGIILAFGVGFIFTYLFLTEYNTGASGESSAILFKRGSNAPVIQDVEAEVKSSDEEKKPSSTQGSGSSQTEIEEARDAAAEAPPMTDIFSWQHLNYTIPLGHGETRKLLDDVSGYVAPGKLTALVGSSGAGKTTLLNTLAQRNDTGVVTGDRFVNGHALPADFQAQTGYVQQMDTHEPTSTVREALLFSAKLRQPASVPLAEKEAYVEKCLKMCGLEAYADAIVGSLGVEHRKRTTIGVELAAKPRLLLFLDEPTSGLDSQSAWAIMSFLRSLADNGQAILCTIHQPSAELFEVFDRLLLLRKGGQTVYFGDLGYHCETLIDYFQRNGGRRCDPDENPAEYILDVTGAGATAQTDYDWHDVWKNSKEAHLLQEEIDKIHADGRSQPPVQATYQSEFATSWPYQVATLFARDCQAHWRDPTYLIAKVALNISSGLLIGFTFFKAKDSIQGSQNKLFAIFMATIIAVPSTNQLQVPFIAMRNVYELRERPSRMYSWSALVTSQIIADIPWNILGSSLFFLCWYWTVGFPSSRGGYTYLMLGVMFPIYYTTIGQSVAAMSPNAEIAGLLFGFFFSFVITFDGVLQPYRQLGWWKWMYRLSPFTYIIEGLLGQAIGGYDITCSEKELVTIEPPSGQTCQSYLQTFINNTGGYVANPDANSSCQYCQFRTTDAFLENSFNIVKSHDWRNFGITFGFIIFNVAATFLFTYLFRIRKGNLFTWIKSKLVRRK
ncbi:pleiotropic drug resistance ABC transporter [Cristinia sonorae]|uniref:Pleiotropic drug resistance ABC transporter n=1 Tax=Cristinia sonorae TaxID=1940300 RepID=A0A8K0URN8_9AGAR|nr:pleiotropic drug resistance ABC transporter [Cristinia sonorae]